MNCWSWTEAQQWPADPKRPKCSHEGLGTDTIRHGAVAGGAGSDLKAVTGQQVLRILPTPGRASVRASMAKGAGPETQGRDPARAL